MMSSDSALILGAGPAGLLAAKALADIGCRSTVVNDGNNEAPVFHAFDRLNIERYLSEMLETTDLIEIRRVDTFPAVRRNGVLCTARFDDGSEVDYGCVIYGPAVSFEPVSSDTPDGTEFLSNDVEPLSNGTTCYVLDYQYPSSPAAGMAAFRAARENAEAGGRSLVVMRHAPVAHLFGEMLYEDAKRAGALFHRHDEDVRIVAGNHPETGVRSFAVTFQDAVDYGKTISLSCDRVLIAGSPEAKPFFSETADGLHAGVDREGFLIPDSIHCNGIRSFKAGIFSLGTASGETDFLRIAAQANLVAAEARAWMLKAQEEAQKETISVSDACIRCLTCSRICPHGAVSFTGEPARSQVRSEGLLCAECGVCAAECPRLAIDIAAVPDAGIEAFLSDLRNTDSLGDTIVVYGCERSPGRASREADIPEGTLMFTVPCAGRVSEQIIWATLAQGVAGVLVIGCHHGNCASDNGTDWAARRVARVIESLPSMGASSTCVGHATVAANESARLARLIRDFRSTLKLGTSAAVG
jgi:coenzyme F420-reducing hydrogenase delta subunit/Pyruvate/2-oxoacid:ferredoxin oxidoreductase delta subunit